MKTRLFRGYDPIYKEWNIGYYAEIMKEEPTEEVKFRKAYCIIRANDNFVEGFSLNFRSTEFDAWIEVVPESVGQLLHVEKNGRQWFEGDIATKQYEVCTSGHSYIGDDEYLKGSRTGIVTINHSAGMHLKDGYRFDQNDESYEQVKGVPSRITFERTSIVGNYFQNPELLLMPKPEDNGNS